MILKKIPAMIMAAVVACIAVLHVSAAPIPPKSGTILQTRVYPLLIDDAEIIGASDEEQLLARLEEISSRQKADVAIITVKNIDDRTITEYTNDFYDYFGYGQGENRDGIMFLVSMSDRKWDITTTGSCKYYFTDAGQEYIMDDVGPMLSDEDYVGAFNTFADYCDDFITEAITDKAYDVGNMPKREFEPLSVIWLFAAIIGGIVVALLVNAKLKGELKTVRYKPEANSYIVPESLNIRNSREEFVSVSVTSTARTKSDDGGGSSTHTSSSGSSHGGSSGSF